MSEIKTSYGWLELENYTSDPTDTDATRGGFAIVGDYAKYWNGTSWVTLESGAGGITTWDGLYDADKTMTIDEATGITWTKTDASGDAFTLAGGALATGDLLQFNNSGSGSDVKGTGDTWSISKAGVIVATGLTMNDDEPITLGDSSDATITWDGTASLLDIAGATNFEDDVTLEASATITQAGSAGSTVLTITAGDAVMSDGSLAITDGDNAKTLSVTNATITTGNTVEIVSDATTSGSILYIDNGGASLDGGYYINCNDDGTSDFTVGEDGAVAITTAVNSTKALEITGIQTAEDLVTLTSSGVTASDSSILLINSSGNSADGSNQIRIAPSGTPVEGSVGLEFVGAGKVMQAMNIDGDSVDNSVVQLNGGGALASDKAVLKVSSDGALATGGNTLRVETTGTPTSGAVYAEFDFAGLTDTNENVGVHIDATSKKVQALKIDAAPIAGSSILATSTGALAENKATAEFVSNVSACDADSSVVRIHQDHTTGVANVVHLVQDDVSEPFIGFESTVGEGNAIEEVGEKSLTTTHYIMVDIEGVGKRYIEVGTIA